LQLPVQLTDQFATDRLNIDPNGGERRNCEGGIIFVIETDQADIPWDLKVPIVQGLPGSQRCIIIAGKNGSDFGEFLEHQIHAKISIGVEAIRKPFILGDWLQSGFSQGMKVSLKKVGEPTQLGVTSIENIRVTKVNQMACGIKSTLKSVKSDGVPFKIRPLVVVS
jgi:hypothetical protein